MTRPIDPSKGRASGGQIAYLIEQVGNVWKWRVYTAIKTLAEGEGRILGANARTVWTIASEPFSEAHFATFPTEIPRRCISAGCPPGGTVLDPFAGSGTTLAVAAALGRNSIGIELNPEYADLIRKRLASVTPALPFHQGEEP